jgi:hypothetical protein
MDSETMIWNQNQRFQAKFQRFLTESADPFFSGPTAVNHTFSDLLRPTGFGIWLDLGLTWLITFGDDFSVLRQQNEPTEQSLRLASQ